MYTPANGRFMARTRGRCLYRSFVRAIVQAIETDLCEPVEITRDGKVKVKQGNKGQDQSASSLFQRSLSSDRANNRKANRGRLLASSLLICVSLCFSRLSYHKSTIKSESKLALPLSAVFIRTLHTLLYFSLSPLSSHFLSAVFWCKAFSSSQTL